MHAGRQREPFAFEFACQGVLFDMDGVLLDTEPLYTVAYDRVLGQHGASLDPETKLFIMGRPALESAKIVIEKYKIPMTPQEFIEARKPVLAELFSAVDAIAGAENFVRQLNRQGIKLAVATSSGRSLFELKTGRHEWFSLFDAVVCGDDPEVEKPKPAPDIFLTAARRIGLSPEVCAIFEDSPTGVKAASAAGGRVYAFKPPHADPELYVLAHTLLDGFPELLSPSVVAPA